MEISNLTPMPPKKQFSRSQNHMLSENGTESYILKSMPDSSKPALVQKSIKYTENKINKIRALYGVRSTITFALESHSSMNGNKLEKKLTKRIKSVKMPKKVLQEKF
jgi:hypothetical protein